MLLIFAGTLAWAWGQVRVKQITDVSALTVAAWISLLGGPQLLMLSWVVEGPPLPYLAAAAGSVWMAIAYMGLAVPVLANGLWYRLVQRQALGRLASITLLVPVFGVVAGAVLLGESVSGRVMLGGAITIAGVALVIAPAPPSRARRPHA